VLFGLFRLSSGVPASLRRERSWKRGTYLTDGERLYRVVSQLTPPTRWGLAELEDCESLTVSCYRAEELWRKWLRPVAPPRSDEWAPSRDVRLEPVLLQVERDAHDA